MYAQCVYLKNVFAIFVKTGIFCICTAIQSFIVFLFKTKNSIAVVFGLGFHASMISLSTEIE